MLTEERQQRILKLLEEQSAITVTELTEFLDASESTIRRDLNALHKMGKLVKVHGGATSVENNMASIEYDMTTKAGIAMTEKKKIAQYAASLIEKDDFVFIDAGSTTEWMIDFINEPAEFVTNGLNHARKLSKKGYRVHVLGGEYKMSTEAIIGVEALRSLELYHFTKAFMGVNGISLKCGYSTPDTQEAYVKRAVIKRAREAFILADHSKFNLISRVTFSALGDAQIITDQKPEENYEEYTVVKEV
ncbi:MAG: DeoR/GlpR transcriptional regulator [Lachnospiraceae bacterium]|nr:DeoR/GlpR transcriptional regulator [Lachnospiraceae bacterium]